jgi:hypothetical protein
MLKDSQPSSQYIFTRAFNKANFIYELSVCRGKKRKTFDLSHLMDLDNLEGEGTAFHTVWQECRKAGMVPEKCELAFLKAYFEFLDYKK